VGVPTTDDNKKTKRLSHRKRQPASNAYRVRLVRGQLDGAPRPRSNSDSYEAPPTGTPRPRPVPYDEAPRPHSDSHEARSPTGKTPTRMTPGRNTRPTQFTYPETKVRAFNAITCYHLSTWPQPGSTWEQCRCQSSLFYRPSRDGGETCHYTHLTVHCLSPVTLEGGYDKAVFRDLGDSVLSVRHRPDLDPASTPSAVRQGRKAGMTRCSGSFHRLIPNVTTVSRDGRPFPGHVATATSTGIDKTSPQGSPVP
jgi:hypothetical protein